jgi:LacI family transcriptional regulator
MSQTLEQIAALAGVSRSTVSRVVNQHPRVDPATRERVLQVIRDQDFHPNTAARTLAGRRSQIIGVVIPQALGSVFADPYFPMLIQGVSAACDERGYYLMVSFVQPQSADAFRRIVRAGHLDGLVVASALTEDAFVQRLEGEGFPFVLIGRPFGESSAISVDVDNERGAAMAVQHLARLGYDRIATITGPLNMVAAVDRREGFSTAMQQVGLEVHADYVQEGDWSEWSGERAMSVLLNLPLRPEAVFAASDNMAIGALKAIRRAGLRVPDDVALVGFDDISLASAVEPPLTTVRQPIHRLGYTAAAVLLDGLLRPDRMAAKQGERIVLPTELVVR